MIARRHKLLAAAAVLGIGTLAAWPLRRRDPLISGTVVPAAEQFSRNVAESAASNLPLKAQPVSSASPQGSGLRVGAHGHGAVETTSLKPLVGQPNAAASAEGMQQPNERIHIIQPGDSLERLAKRYFDDAGRAMEIFESNRDVLANPHLLPLGAELRIHLHDSRPLDRSASGMGPPLK